MSTGKTRGPWGWTGLALVGALLMSGLLVWSLEQDRREVERTRVESLARDYVRALGNEIERSLTASYALGALIRQGQGELPEFEALGTEMLQFYPSVSVLALSPGGVITQTVPFEENRASIGFNQFEDPIQGAEARRARDSGAMTLAGPLNLVQGGLGVVGRLPVFLPAEEEAPGLAMDGEGSGEFWGLVNVVIPVTSVLEEAGLEVLEELGVDYELWRTDPNMSRRQVIASSGSLPLSAPEEHSVELPNGSWTLSAAPSGGWSDPLLLTVNVTGALLFSLLVAWITHLLLVLRAHRRRLEDEVEVRTAEIQEARNQLAGALAAIPDLLFEVDADGVYHEVYARREELLAAPRSQVIGSRVEDCLTGDPLNAVLRSLREAEVHGWSLGQQYELELPDGPHWFELSVARKPVAEGAAPRFMVLARDISARKSADTALRESEARYLHAQKMESIGRLAGGVAHDFNNLLTVIQGAAELARSDLPEDHPARIELTQVLASARRGAALTQQLLGYSSQQVMRPEILDLNDQVKEFQEMAGRIIGDPVEVEVDLSDSPVWIEADPNQLSQILLNLATNARDAMPQGGLLTLETRRVKTTGEEGSEELPAMPGEWVRLRVSDTGIGMTPKIRERIFDPFFTTKEKGQGTGLGLATVYGIVRQLGGGLACRSEPGAGTSFDLFFPSLKGPAEALAAEAVRNDGLASG